MGDVDSTGSELTSVLKYIYPYLSKSEGTKTMPRRGYAAYRRSNQSSSIHFVLCCFFHHNSLFCHRIVFVYFEALLVLPHSACGIQDSTTGIRIKVVYLIE